MDVSVERIEDVFKVLHVLGYEGTCSKKPDFRRLEETRGLDEASLDAFLADDGFMQEAWMKSPTCDLHGWSIARPPADVSAGSNGDDGDVVNIEGSEWSGGGWEGWIATWQLGFSEWWLALPLSASSKLQHCAAFLGGALSGRSDST